MIREMSCSEAARVRRSVLGLKIGDGDSPRSPIAVATAPAWPI